MAAPSVNLLAYLRPEAITVNFHERLWPLQATTAFDWLGALAHDFSTLAGVFPGLIADDQLDDMFHMSLREDLGQPWFECAQQVLGWAGGRDWWWTLNLAKMCLGGWIFINGKLLREGVNASTCTLPDWLDAAYTLLYEGRDENERMKLDLELSMRPVGVKMKQSGEAKRKMLEAFAAD